MLQLFLCLTAVMLLVLYFFMRVSRAEKMKKEEIHADWADIWKDRLKNGR
jgi:hypothetical protein